MAKGGRRECRDSSPLDSVRVRPLYDLAPPLNPPPPKQLAAHRATWRYTKVAVTSQPVKPRQML